MSTVAQRVAAGVEWLDANYPDWRDNVTLEYFDIQDSSKCVLGQLFESEAFDEDGYWYAIHRGYVEDVEELGFDGQDYDSNGEYIGLLIDYEFLQEEWTRVLSDG